MSDSNYELPVEYMESRTRQLDEIVNNSPIVKAYRSAYRDAPGGSEGLSYTHVSYPKSVRNLLYNAKIILTRPIQEMLTVTMQEFPSDRALQLLTTVAAVEAVRTSPVGMLELKDAITRTDLRMLMPLNAWAERYMMPGAYNHLQFSTSYLNPKDSEAKELHRIAYSTAPKIKVMMALDSTEWYIHCVLERNTPATQINDPKILEIRSKALKKDIALLRKAETQTKTRSLMHN